MIALQLPADISGVFSQPGEEQLFGFDLPSRTDLFVKVKSVNDTCVRENMWDLSFLLRTADAQLVTGEGNLLGDPLSQLVGHPAATGGCGDYGPFKVEQPGHYVLGLDSETTIGTYDLTIFHRPRTSEDADAGAPAAMPANSLVALLAVWNYEGGPVPYPLYAIDLRIEGRCVYSGDHAIVALPAEQLLIDVEDSTLHLRETVFTTGDQLGGTGFNYEIEPHHRTSAWADCITENTTRVIVTPGLSRQ